MRTPFIETLKYLELHLKKVESDRYNGFMDLFFSNKQNFGEKTIRMVQDYVKAIEPQKPRKKLKLETDLDQLKRLKEEQEERAKSNQGG